ncbi:MAG TPA: nuclear transport factor 2 family protein [Phnomibacter sp.]|nr:nuclear transport factor 2 family protein [Phnomibacter sp.]
MTAIEVVQKQLDFYNRQDVKSFAAMFAEDVKVFQQLGDSLPSLQGRKAVEKRYGEIFAQYPQNYSTLLGRMVQGDFVIDHEWITGREKELRIMAIYEVKDGLIRRCWFIR